MENATDALKIAFAIFVFIVAVTLLFMQLTKIKKTADSVLFSADKTNFYTWNTGNLEKGRIVSEESVINTLHNQAKESTYVIVKNDNNANEYVPDETEDAVKAKEEFIKNNLHKGKLYLENIIEITTSGEYRIAEDGTKIIKMPGVTRTYVTYTEI